MRQLASIQKITSLEPIEGADKIEKATILGWELVVLKGEFQEGELCVYCEMDSILPERPEFEFLRPRKFRIRTIRLRKQVSQGICFSLSILPVKTYYENMDVTEILGIIKYDPQAEQERRMQSEQDKVNKNRFDKFFRRYNWYRSIFKKGKGAFPSFIKKTDEDRIQLFPHICDKEKDTIFQSTEKLDGQSATYFLIKNRHKWQFWNPYLFGVCSRNVYLIKEDTSSYWEMARKYNIKESMMRLVKESGMELYIQGEIIGTGIQGNKYGLTEKLLYVFNIVPVSTRNPCDNYQIETICNSLGLKIVPCLDYNFNLQESIHETIELAKGKSVIADIPREGLVVRNYSKGLSFKIVNPNFLLKYDE